MHLTPPSSDGRRSIALPLDRVIAVGGGVEWQWKDFEMHNSLSYAHIGAAAGGAGGWPHLTPLP
jgi:hypothetical protein